METRNRRRGGKSARAAPSDPSVRPPSPVSESAAESEGESEAEVTLGPRVQGTLVWYW